MDDIRPVFGTLEGASGEGLALRKVIIGDSPVGKNGSLAFAFIDSNGNIVMPQLTGDGRLPVSLDAAGNPVKNRGEVPDGSASGSFVDVASVNLTASKTVTGINMTVSCRQAALFQLCQEDNGSVTVLDDVILDAGQFTFHEDLNKEEITTGATGVQRLFVRGFNLKSPLSPLRARVSAIEVVS